MPCVLHFSTVPSKPPGEYMRSGGPSPMTSYRVAMPAMTVLGRALPFQVPRGTNVIGVRADGSQRDARHACVRLLPRVELRRGITDRGMRHAQAPVEPGAAAEAAEHP